MIDRHALQKYLADLLHVADFHDYAPNGLQVQGEREITSIVTGVTACQALIDAAILHQAEAILVHHGYFWKGEDPCLVGMKYERIEKLMKHRINLFAYHLPLDAEPSFGNNAELAKQLNLKVKDRIAVDGNPNMLWLGKLAQPLSAHDFSGIIANQLQRQPQVVSAGDKDIETVAWCTGAAQDFIELAHRYEVDAFISGEISERTFHQAREYGLHYFAVGHHASERGGIKALGEKVARKFDLACEFVDIANPF